MTPFLRYLTFVTAAIALTSTATSAPVVPRVKCDVSATTMRVIALERRSQGQLTLKIEYESDANIKQKVVPMKFYATDDAKQRYAPSSRLPATELSPGSTIQVVYQLVAPTGSAESAFANLAVSFRVYGEKFKPKDCDFTITGVPIANASR